MCVSGKYECGCMNRMYSTDYHAGMNVKRETHGLDDVV